MKTKVLHVSPTYFSPDSVMGGGERYVWELARAMSKFEDVTLLSFGKKAQNYTDGEMKVVIKSPWFYIRNNILNPFSIRFFKEVSEADVIHVHQIFTVLTEVCLIYCWLLKKPIYLTDHGGGGRTFLLRWGLTKLATGILAVSDYSSAQLLHLNKSHRTIYGGVNLDTFQFTSNQARANKIISVGRILPHKGFHHLISAIDKEYLTIVGQVRDEEYFQFLKKISEKKNVTFIHDASDDALKAKISESSLAVFPSTNIDQNGNKLSGQPELLGIAPLEAMALNIPTLVSDIGAYPEICFDSKNYLFKHGNVNDLKKKISFLLNTENKNQDDFRSHVKNKFTWPMAARRCLEFYKP